MEAIDWQDRNGVRWVELEGELDHDVTLELKERLERAVEGSEGDVILVMEGVTFLCSMAMGLLVSLQKRLEQRDHALYLKELRPAIREILGSMDLLKVFQEL